MSTEENIKAVLTGIMGTIEQDNADALAVVAADPSVLKAKEALAKGCFDDFKYALAYPFGKLLDGLLAAEFPSSPDARFLFKQADFIHRHFRQAFSTFEGGCCCADKSKAVMRALLRYFRTGQEIAFDYGQEYTFHLPKRILRTHAEVLAYFQALQRMYYGHADLYLAVLAGLQQSPSPAQVEALAPPCSPQPEEQMSQEEAVAWRQSALAALPRIGVSPIETPVQFRRRVEDCALEVGAMLASSREKQEMDWWCFADLLDDLLDILDATPP